MWSLEIMKRMNERAANHSPEFTRPNPLDDGPLTTNEETVRAADEYLRKTKEPKRYGHPKFHAMLAEIGDLHDKKNFDYAEGGEQGPLGNFTRVANIKRLYPGSGWSDAQGVALTYMLKQFDAALMIYTTGKTSQTGEGLKQRLTDVAVYALLTIILSEEGEGS
jgi:hypothetical protein